MGITALRRKLCAYASGRVLEVATGTAANLRYYTPEVDALTLVDSSEAMLKVRLNRGEVMEGKRMQPFSLHKVWGDVPFKILSG